VGGARARWAILVGLLGVAAIPVAVFATRYSKSYDLVHAALATPVALALGVEALVLARQARSRSAARVGSPQKEGWAVPLGWALGVAAISLALAGLIALAVYGILTYVGES
jgi:peptidoglycan/LPS O-acetylase OafA/YrhL